MVLIPQLLIIALLLYIIWNVTYTMLRGAPYAPLGKYKIETMIKLLDIKPGDKAVDLGAGDGRVVIALARKGAEAHGYELNPLLALWAKWNIRQAGLNGKAYIHTGDFWKVDLSKFNIITVYLTSHIMGGVEKKIIKEAKLNTKIAVNYYKLPTLKAVKIREKIYLYKIT